MKKKLRWKFVWEDMEGVKLCIMDDTWYIFEFHNTPSSRFLAKLYIQIKFYEFKINLMVLGSN